LTVNDIGTFDSFNAIHAHFLYKSKVFPDMTVLRNKMCTSCSEIYKNFIINIY